MTAIELLAKKSPDRKVRIIFRNHLGVGVLETTAAHAACPNRPQRFFPPADQNATMMGWPVPYWYAHEAELVVLL